MVYECFCVCYDRPLTQSYQEVARSVFLVTGDKKRKSHSEVQEKVNVLWANAKLFDKGIKLFNGRPTICFKFVQTLIRGEVVHFRLSKSLTFVLFVWE